MTHPACRLCGDKMTQMFADLGAMPHARCLASTGAGEDQCHPLRVLVCRRCLLVQSGGYLDEDIRSLSRHATASPGAEARVAASLIGRFSLTATSRVMEAGSTDGDLLLAFQEAGIPVLGIEPDQALAARAQARGVPTEAALLNAETAMEIAAAHGRGDLVIARGVLAEVPDLFGFAAGFAGILRPNGIAAFEFPHLLDLMEQTRFDRIDHAQCSYLSLLVVERILRSVGLSVFDLERLPAPGGLRVFACHARGPYLQRPSVRAMRAKEVAAGLDHAAGYNAFAPRMEAATHAIRDFVATRRRLGRRITAHGVTPETNSLLNACGLTLDDIVCIADPAPDKQGMRLPGSRVPVVSPLELAAARPDDVLIFGASDPLDIVADLAARLPVGTAFWGLLPTPHAMTPHLEAA